MNNPKYIHTLSLEVRDYECDLQGIVNNAVYQHYFEHARHSFLRSINLDFAEHAKRGILMVVTRIEMDFKSPLKPGDKFEIGTKMERISRLRFLFSQDVVKEDGTICVSTQTYGAVISTVGRPVIPPDLEAILATYAPQSQTSS